MLDAKLLKPRSLMETETAYRGRQLSGLSRNAPQARPWVAIFFFLIETLSMTGQKLKMAATVYGRGQLRRRRRY